MGTLLQDLRYGLRMLAKNPGFTAVAVMTLALGIGANTAIFSVVNAVLLRPLPYKDSSRLFRLWSTDTRNGTSRDVCSYPEFWEWKAQSHSFEQMAAYSHRYYNFAGGDRPERLSGLRTSAGLLEALEVKPAQGRSFLPEEYQTGANHVVLLTDGVWARRFARDPNLLGKTVRLNEENYTVVGILPPRFAFIPDDSTGLLVPLVGDPNRNHGYLTVMGRLKPGVTLAQAQTEMNSIARRIEMAFPKEEKGRGINLVSLQESFVGDLRPAFLIFVGSVGLVLLIACANAANLFLARTTARQKELAVRATLGAGRIRLVRQLLTESVLVAVAGGALGLLLAVWGADTLVALVRRNFAGAPFPEHAGTDVWVLGFTFAASLVTGIVAGLAPALGASSPDMNETLKEGSRGLTGGTRRNRLQSALAVSEVALALVLLIGAGLMMKSFLLLQRVNPGLDPQDVLAVDFSLYETKYEQTSSRNAFFRQVLENVKALPGVQSVAAVSDIPLSGNVDTMGFSIAGRPAPAPGKSRHAGANVISPGYFSTLRIPLLRGRDFTEQDVPGAPGVAIINQTMADRFFPGEDPRGKRISTDKSTWYSIIGVSADVRHLGLERDPRPEFYMNYLQDPFRWPYLSMLVRTTSDPHKLVGAVQGAVWAVDKDKPLSNFRTMEEILSSSMAQPRVSTLLLAVFAVLALVLATVGIYGVIAYSVTQRTHEMGIRMALGAEQRDVLKLVVGQGAVLALTGVGIGLVGAFALTRFLSNLLYGVGTADPLTYLAVSLALVIVAMIASYIPARRATKVDPMVALRYE